MNELEKLREQIDDADKTIVSSFETRMRCVKEVAQYKVEHGMKVLDKSREEEVLEKREAMLQNKELSLMTRRLFRFLMKLSRSYQQEILAEDGTEEQKQINGIVAFQGEEGANSQAAAKLFFGDGTNSRNYASFEDVFCAVGNGDAEYGVVPIENSDTGSIPRVYDLLNEYELHITGEQYLPIDHKLLAAPGAFIEGITDVYSHEQALLQCSEYLKGKPFHQHPYFNTAVSAKYVAQEQDKTKAAIASAYAARLYGLAELEEDISNSEENTTRFIIVAKKPYSGKAANKASVCFVLDHCAGALAKALQLFADHDLNMVKIESRPLEGRNFEYMFYVDFEGEGVENRVDTVSRNNGGVFRMFELLGVYPKNAV